MQDDEENIRLCGRGAIVEHGVKKGRKKLGTGSAGMGNILPNVLREQFDAP